MYASLSALSCKPTNMTGVGGGEKEEGMGRKGKEGVGKEKGITPERLRNRSRCTIVTRCQHVFGK